MNHTFIAKNSVTDIFKNCVESFDPYIYNKGIFSIFGSFLDKINEDLEEGVDIDILLILSIERKFEKDSNVISIFIEILKCITDRLKGRSDVWIYPHVFLGLLASESSRVKIHFLYYPTLYDALSIENPFLLKNILQSLRDLRSSLGNRFDYIVDSTITIPKLMTPEETYIRFTRMRAVSILNTIVLNNLLVRGEKERLLAEEMFKLAIKYYNKARTCISKLPELNLPYEINNLDRAAIFGIIRDILVNTENIIEKLLR